MAAVVATIPVGNFPGVVAVSPDGTHAYVVNCLGGTVSVIDTATNTVSGHDPGRQRSARCGDQPRRRPRLRHQQRDNDSCR